jgi:hypothetical protein
MKRGSIGVLLLLAGLLAGAWLTSAPPATSQEVAFVRVTNFPPVQEINGVVEIDGPIRLAQLAALREITLPPVRSDETTRWVDAGVIETSGFPSVVLSLNGEIKGELIRSGSITAVLIPTEESVVDAFDEEGMVQFGLNVSATGETGTRPYFASDQPRYTVAFDAYRVYLYNETNKTVTANVFAYLTN